MTAGEARPIWLVRHGESTANAKRVFAGHHDVDLTPRGEDQARALAPIFARLDPERVLSSDLRRAVRTAELAWPRRSPPLEIVPALRERDMGAWEGRAIDRLTHEERARLISWEGQPPGGESQAMLARRVLTWLAEHDDGRSTALFVHGGLIRSVLGLLDGTPRERIGVTTVKNGDISMRIVHDGLWESLLDRM